MNPPPPVTNALPALDIRATLAQWNRAVAFVMLRSS